MTVTAKDVAAFILRAKGTMTAMKLQKLVYYSQAWSLVWDGEPLFDDQIEAWANGPVTYALFQHHRGKYTVGAADFADGDPEELDLDQRETVQAVLDAYGDMSAGQLSALTHAEKPWRAARGSAEDGEKSRAVITPSSMQEYYAELSAAETAVQDVQDVDFPAWVR